MGTPKDDGHSVLCPYQNETLHGRLSGGEGVVGRRWTWCIERQMKSGGRKAVCKSEEKFPRESPDASSAALPATRLRVILSQRRNRQPWQKLPHTLTRRA